MNKLVLIALLLIGILYNVAQCQNNIHIVKCHGNKCVHIISQLNKQFCVAKANAFINPTHSNIICM